MEIDYELLKSCVKFPLKADDYGGYIWDANDDMLAHFERPHKDLASNLIVGDMRLFEGETTDEIYSLDPDFNFLIHYNSNTLESAIGCVRGWGHLQYKYNKKKGTKKYDLDGGIKRHDNLAAYLLKCLNTPRNK
jgi:hypothetical protein